MPLTDVQRTCTARSVQAIASHSGRITVSGNRTHARTGRGSAGRWMGWGSTSSSASVKLTGCARIRISSIPRPIPISGYRRFVLTSPLEQKFESMFE